MSLQPAALCLAAVGAICLAWQKYCNRPPVWVSQMENLGRKRDKCIPGTAVICGGSIAGTIAARVCADHFERIVVVDPDVDEPEKDRTRIMQRNSLHLYLCLFVQGARRLWSNFDEEVERAGGRFSPADLQLHYSGAELLTPYKQYPPGELPATLPMRRSSFQKVIHRILLGMASPGSHIRVLAGTVRGIGASPDGRRVESVTVRGLDGKQIEVNDVALVVDCTGRNQDGFKWLRSAGYDIPADARCSYDPSLRYLTCSFTVSPEMYATFPIPDEQRKTTFVYAYVPHDDAKACICAVIRTDNDVVQCFLGDTGGTDLPRDPADIVPFVEKFSGCAKPIPGWVIDTIKMLVERCGPPTIDFLKLAPLQYIRYQKVVDRLPANFIAVGDAGLFLNPIHGQGFAKAMMNGITLNALLHSSGLTPDFSKRYFKLSAKAMQGLWDATRLHDYGSLSCTPMDGETRETGRVARWIEKKLITAATKDEEVASALWHVRQMLQSESVLLAPKILFKVLTTRSMFE
ncbi:hypothetical protein HMN09_00577400 [Mycena chlorophos]|uniref:FAD/NAD(P)-binding domain-containing protein n=1 Tax=Mycena chlorophos TaxID=658473 RepID=A0A8H6T3G6_MYCCL|nr:hypothetical protein HMN09_00577400 [Mycena chlorophos]